MRRRLVWLLLLLPIVAPLTAFALASLKPTPSTVAFPSRCVRTSADRKKVTVKNEGNPGAIEITVRISPSSRATLFPLSGETARATLEPADSFDFSVGFVPEAAGTASADAIIEYKAVATPTKHNSPTPSPSPSQTKVALTGSAIDRFVDASPKALNFGSVRVGRDAAPRTVTIYDDGDSPLTVTSITLDGEDPGDFSVSNRGPATVRDGNPVRVSLGFKPSRAGGRKAKLVIRTNACEDPTISVDLGGIGVVPDIVPTPVELNFGERQLSRRTRERVRVQNVGHLDLRVTAIAITGADRSAFSLPSKPSLPRTLRSGQALTFDVRFVPPDPGPYMASLRIESNDPDTKVLRIALQGEGVIRTPSPSPSPTPSEAPTLAPPPPPPSSDGWFDFPIGKYALELGVGGSVLGFFVLLVIVRRLKGIPE